MVSRSFFRSTLSVTVKVSKASMFLCLRITVLVPQVKKKEKLYLGVNVDQFMEAHFYQQLDECEQI